MASSLELKAICMAARPFIEQQLDLAEQIAAIRDTATAKGFDWSQIKALLKAQIQDERDDAGENKRVQKIIDRAEHASAYAGMLGLNMNEKNFPSPSAVNPLTADKPEATPNPQQASGALSKRECSEDEIPDFLKQSGRAA